MENSKWVEGYKWEILELDLAGVSVNVCGSLFFFIFSFYAKIKVLKIKLKKLLDTFEFNRSSPPLLGKLQAVKPQGALRDILDANSCEGSSTKEHQLLRALKGNTTCAQTPKPLYIYTFVKSSSRYG